MRFFKSCFLAPVCLSSTRTGLSDSSWARHVAPRWAEGFERNTSSKSSLWMLSLCERAQTWAKSRPEQISRELKIEKKKRKRAKRTTQVKRGMTHTFLAKTFSVRRSAPYSLTLMSDRFRRNTEGKLWCLFSYIGEQFIDTCTSCFWLYKYQPQHVVWHHV